MLASASKIARPRLFIVDDDPVLLAALPQMFSARLPYLDVCTCDSGDELLKAITRIPCHAVISDLRMPKMNGLDLLREVRQHGSTVPFLFMTERRDYALALEALNRGAQDFILKPFEHDDLVKSIRLAVKVQRLRSQVESKRQAVVTLETRIALFQEQKFARAAFPRGPAMSDLLLRKDQALALMNESVGLLQQRLQAMALRCNHLIHCLQATEELARRTARWRLQRLDRTKPFL